MWLWQSQAPAGTLKLTGVAGCVAVANAGVDLRPYRSAANPPTINSRRLTFPLFIDVMEGRSGRRGIAFAANSNWRNGAFQLHSALARTFKMRGLHTPLPRWVQDCMRWRIMPFPVLLVGRWHP